MKSRGLTAFLPVFMLAMMGSRVAPTHQNYGGVSMHGAIPLYIPQRKKFKGFQREQHLGRRRSRFYFNKNR